MSQVSHKSLEEWLPELKVCTKTAAIFPGEENEGCVLLSHDFASHDDAEFVPFVFSDKLNKNPEAKAKVYTECEKVLFIMKFLTL